MLTPLKVNVPTPTLVNPPVPLITPLKVVVALLFPVVKVPEPKLTLPLPAKEPIVSLKLFKFNVVAALKATSLAALIALLTASCTLPADTLVAPV